VDIIATASEKHHERLGRLGATVVVDYASLTAVEEVVAALREGREDGTPLYAVDPISAKSSAEGVVEVLRRVGGEGGAVKVAKTLPWPAGLEVLEGLEVRGVEAQDLWGKREDLAKWLYGEALPVWLADGRIVPANARVLERGLEGIQDGLEKLKRGVSGEKLVVEL